MDVRTLRFRAAKEGKEMIPGLRTDYDGPDHDIDFMSDAGLIAWVPRSREDSEEASKAVTYSEAEDPEAIKALENFLKEGTANPVPVNKLAMLLRVNREGEFIATDDSQTEHQCGTVGARRYRYFVSIEAKNGKLTEEGFVMENLWVAEYFRDRYELLSGKCASCEDMAQEAVQHFFGLFQTKPELVGIELTRIYVRIHGSDVSFIEAEWKPEV